jgi:hypothetical protein
MPELSQLDGGKRGWLRKNFAHKAPRKQPNQPQRGFLLTKSRTMPENPLGASRWGEV